MLMSKAHYCEMISMQSNNEIIINYKTTELNVFFARLSCMLLAIQESATLCQVKSFAVPERIAY